MIDRLLLVVGVCLSLNAAADPVSTPVSTQLQGLRLNGDLSVAQGQTLAAGVVVLVHGSLAHQRMEIIATLQELLVETGYNTLSINLSLSEDDRGASMYDCAALHRHRHQDAVGEIRAWVDWLAARGSGPVVLAGHSLGGNQVARYAAEHPSPRLRALVLLAPPVWDAAASQQRHRAALQQATAAMDKGEPETVLELPAFLHCGQSRVSAASAVSYLGLEEADNTPALLARVGLPTLVVVGSADPLAESLQPALAPWVQGPGRVLLVIDDADHFFRDLYAEEVIEAVDEFLQQQ